MPIDKQSPTTNTKPVTPALSSRFRNAKTTVVPKVAGSIPNSSTPLSPSVERAQAQSLNGNITPRSGARNARISTESPSSPGIIRRTSGGSTISGILSTTRSTPTTTNSPSSQSLSQNRQPLRAHVSTTSDIRRTSSTSDISKKDDIPSKFIRASDAKPTPVFHSPKSKISPRPFSTSPFKSGSPKIIGSAPQPGSQNARFGQKDPAFVRAYDVQARAAKAPIIARQQSTTSITSVKSVRSRSPGSADRQNRTPPYAQSVSTKRSGKAQITNSAKSNPSVQQSPSMASPKLTSPASPSERRKSFGTGFSNTSPSRPILHRKSASVNTLSPPPKFTSTVSTILPIIEAKWKLPLVSIPPPPPPQSFIASSPETLSPRSTSLASSKTVGTSVTSDTDISEISKMSLPTTFTGQADTAHQPSILQQLGATPLAQAQMQAANARRERKVLDLEISNSSLLAINKTLEKELKKQSAELRRFRRLSRSGRLSLAPSHRSVSGQSALSLDTLQEQSEDEDEYSEDEDEYDDESDAEDAGDEVKHGLYGSPGSMTARARQRARDERRLMLDLSKHQQLLIDSQKLTQSIRKCLNLSDTLIKEADQALKYKVGIGDLKLGGRVLSAEDYDANSLSISDTHDPGVDTSRQGLLSPSITRAELDEAALWLGNGSMPIATIDPYIHDLRDPG